MISKNKAPNTILLDTFDDESSKRAFCAQTWRACKHTHFLVAVCLLAACSVLFLCFTFPAHYYCRCFSFHLCLYKIPTFQTVTSSRTSNTCYLCCQWAATTTTREFCFKWSIRSQQKMVSFWHILIKSHHRLKVKRALFHDVPHYFSSSKEANNSKQLLSFTPL